MKTTLPSFDRRLLGTWKSDRRKTFEHYKPPSRMSQEQFRKLRLLFGKLIIRWGKGKVSTSICNFKESAPYKIIAGDSKSVVIQAEHLIYGPDCLTQIHFEGDYYWIALDDAHICEWFRRIK